MNRFYRLLETKQVELKVEHIADFQKRWHIQESEFNKILTGAYYYIPEPRMLKIIATDLGIQIIELIYLLTPLCEQCKFRIKSRRNTESGEFDVTPKVECRNYEFYGINPPTSKIACHDFFPFFNNFENRFELVTKNYLDDFESLKKKYRKLKEQINLGPQW